MVTNRAGGFLNGITVTVIAAVVIVACEALAWPFGDFPLNDDWTYAIGVKNLVDTGKFTITAWTLAGAVFSVFSAALLCKIFGFSFHVLRIYNFLLGLNCVFITGFLSRGAGAGWLPILFSALVLFTNPLYFCLVNSFMMDIPTASLLVTSAALLYLSWQNQGARRGWFVASGSLFATLAVSNREVTVLFPVAYLLLGILLFLLQKARKLADYKGVSLAESAAPLLLSSVAIALHGWWIVNVSGVPFCMLVEQTYLTQSMVAGPGRYLLSCLFALMRLFVYLGLLMLPVSALAAPRLLRIPQGKAAKILAAMTVELLILLPLALKLSNNTMPLGDNIIYDFGLGPMILNMGELGPKGLPEYRSSPILWEIVTAFSGIGLALLLGCFGAIFLVLKERFLRGGWQHKHSLITLLLLFSGIYIVMICARGFFDRYLILLLLPGIIMLNFHDTPATTSGVETQKSMDSTLKTAATGASFPVKCLSLLTAAGSAAVFAFYSVAGTRDYFQWNAARWSVLYPAVEHQKLDPADIDGGYEFNGWYIYEPGNKVIDVTKNDQRQGNDKYVLTVRKLPGYKVLKKVEFDSLLWGPGHAVYFQEKVPVQNNQEAER
ncbi:MAG: hypothetical protein K2W95_31435 [Candidatus Obscuribacterales bacterium]|nr:hypothetical protein [Candidatus Obscuribacterales bacterium]